MSIKIITAKAHREQLKDIEIQQEINGIEEQINKVHLNLKDNTINNIFIKGIYKHDERKMITVCLFVNCMDKTISELHGVLRMKFKNKNALIAKATLDFDRDFMGYINPNEALLVHIGIPVKGLTKDETFKLSDISGQFEDVRVTID